MNIKNIIPKWIKYKLKQIYFKNKYGAKIYSPNVDINCNLSKNVEINQRVYIGKDVRIGAYSYVNYNSIIESGRIGNFCSIGPNVVIGMDEHPYNFVTTHPILYNEKLKWYDKKNNNKYLHDNKILNKKPPIIGNDVWIGANSVILKDVIIGDGAIIGAGSIVTKDVEPFAIVGGIPAKLLKYRFSEDIRKKLLEISWWNWSEQKIKENIDLFYNVDKFIEL